MQTIVLILLILSVPSLAHAQDRGLLDELYGQALREKAESGDPRAQTALGDEYQMGVGAAKTPDLVKAAYWYRRAAEKGFAKAQNYLGEMYKLGKGVPQDFSKAAYWYHRAANQGDTMAQLSLGILYSDGKGVQKDLVQAYKWIALAEPNLPEIYFLLSGGVSPLREVEKLMTPSETLLGKQLVEKWNPQPEWEPKKYEGSAAGGSVDTKPVSKATLDILQRDFRMAEALAIIEASPTRSASRDHLRSHQRLRFLATQEQTPMVLDGYTVIDPKSSIIGYSFFYYGTKGPLVIADAAVNPVHTDVIQIASSLVTAALDAVSNPDGSRMYFLGIYDLDRSRVIKIMIRRGQTPMGPDYAIRYVVSQR